jgi:phenylalanine-4-hydroxylase
MSLPTRFQKSLRYTTRRYFSQSRRPLVENVWFPRTMHDLDLISSRVLDNSDSLDVTHPGFKDIEYRKRRDEIVSLAKLYKWGDELPYIHYTSDEKDVWKRIYETLLPLYERYACKEYLEALPMLERNAGFGSSSIPQLRDVSHWLSSRTGWVLRPVSGLLSSRDFLNSLAFKTFQSTQYLRHQSVPLYTPEPDVCHELLGHIPLFSNPSFSAFSQQVGFASLGASEEQIDKLATLYWYTIEFGLCKEGSDVKAYGAGLLSSFGELQHSVEHVEKHVPFNVEIASTNEYTVTKYQNRYFVADSFDDMREKVADYARRNIYSKQPFTLSWDDGRREIHVIE